MLRCTVNKISTIELRLKCPYFHSVEAQIVWTALFCVQLDQSRLLTFLHSTVLSEQGIAFILKQFRLQTLLMQFLLRRVSQTPQQRCTVFYTEYHRMHEDFYMKRSYIFKYSNICPTRCNVTQFILSGNCSTCFGWYHHPSSGAQTTISTASGIYTPLLLPAAVVERLELV